MRGASIHTRLLVCFVETHDSERTEKENSGSFKSLDEVGTNEYQFDLEIDIETAIIHSELEKEQLEVLQKELNNLTKQQREVLYLKYYKKMSPEEIAQVMGLTSRTVYNTTHMAISSLRERMSKSFLLLVAANLWILIEVRYGKWTESLEQYLEEGKLPLVGEIFSRKKEIGDKLKLQREESHKITLSRKRKQSVGKSFSFSWGVAAAVVLLLGVGSYFLAEEKVVTDNTAMNYELPDGSSVQVMENSRLTYNHITWLWERKLQLLGKASFNVTKGKTFTVSTEAGDVTVLGTKFLVDQQGKKMFVNCEEGSVKVETAVGKRTLLAGESVRCDETKIVPVEKRRKNWNSLKC